MSSVEVLPIMHMFVVEGGGAWGLPPMVATLFSRSAGRSVPNAQSKLDNWKLFIVSVLSSVVSVWACRTNADLAPRSVWAVCEVMRFSPWLLVRVALHVVLVLFGLIFCFYKYGFTLRVRPPWYSQGKTEKHEVPSKRVTRHTRLKINK